jgi:hypothetical protein
VIWAAHGTPYLCVVSENRAKWGITRSSNGSTPFQSRPVLVGCTLAVSKHMMKPTPPRAFGS